MSTPQPFCTETLETLAGVETLETLEAAHAVKLALIVQGSSEEG